MSMPANPEYRKEKIGRALDQVKLGAKVRGWFSQFDEGHRHKTDEFDQISSDMLEGSIRDALDYGFPVEAVAVAASMTVEEVSAIADGSAAL